MHASGLGIEITPKPMDEREARTRRPGASHQDVLRVLTAEDLAYLSEGTGKPAETLLRVVALTATHFGADSCSVFLLEPDRTNLVLAAAIGIHPRFIGNLRMPLTEGIVGLVAEELRPIAVPDAKKHPRFKTVEGSGEEEYASFLGVPIIDRGILQGVLVIETKESRVFEDSEIRQVTRAAGQLAPMVSDARSIDRFIAPTQEKLWALARNTWWSWDQDCISLFRDLNPTLWRELNQNPIALLNVMPFEEVERRATEFVLHSRIDYCYRRLNEYLADENTWGAENAVVLRPHPVAYFSAEFGLHESLPIYSGGLGILAGDHIKSASDLDVPLIGVGLFYGQGYFLQRLDRSGWQVETYVDTDVKQVPMHMAIGKDGRAVVVTVETRSRPLRAKVWRVRVGRCDLLLLDPDVEGNAPEDRSTSERLYGGDSRTRIRQELMLGVGGFRALKAMGITPSVLHLNEGHSAFALLEAIRDRMEEEGVDFQTAAARVQRTVVFTSHTSVPAGHDRFTPQLIDEHLGPLREQLGLTQEELMSFGRENPANRDEPFLTTVLAIKLSGHVNAVSALHGEVSRNLFKKLFPVQSEDAVPIGHITNGVHVPSWLSPQMGRLYDRHLGAGWQRRNGDAKTWEAIENVDDGELWETHLSLKAQLLEFVRRRLMLQATQRGEPEQSLHAISKMLSPDALTIGFARRFATHKRANLLLGEMQRLSAMVNDAKHPVQFIFAGKAHPLDDPGKRVLQEVIKATQQFADRFVFVEDYDIHVGRFLVQGVDVWLNTPRRPLEASGTSGQKVVLNGGLNLSVLDGWWAEAYDGLNGFAIGSGRIHSRPEVHDSRDRADLFRTLQDEVIPLYYERDNDGLPRKWIKRIKRAIRTLGWRFNADRMVMDYTQNCYIPAAGGTSSQMRMPL